MGAFEDNLSSQPCWPAQVLADTDRSWKAGRGRSSVGRQWIAGIRPCAPRPTRRSRAAPARRRSRNLYFGYATGQIAANRPREGW